jgi:O-palmitoleoyl-L-serine hydrolase
VDGGQPLYFSGRLNARAMLDILRRDYGLDDRDPAVKIIWTGQSAGGQGAQNNADQLARAMPKARAAQRLWVIANAGWMPLNWNNPQYTQGGLGDPDTVVSERLATLYQAEFSPECRALAQAAGRPASACFAGMPMVASIHRPVSKGGLGLRLLAATNRRDPVYTGHHGLTDTRAQTNAAMQEWDDLMAEEMRGSGVRWLFAPSDDPRVGANKLHGFYDGWQVPFKAYEPAQDVCDVPYTVTDYREMVTRFFEDPTPDTSRLKVCFNGEWLP